MFEANQLEGRHVLAKWDAQELPFSEHDAVVAVETEAGGVELVGVVVGRPAQSLVRIGPQDPVSLLLCAVPSVDRLVTAVANRAARRARERKTALQVREDLSLVLTERGISHQAELAPGGRVVVTLSLEDAQSLAEQLGGAA